MESEARYVLVGAVVLFLATLGAIGAFWFSYAGDEKSQTLYRIYFKEQSLAGLQVGSIVTMRGIRIGSVSSFKILPDEREGVEVVIAIEPTTPVRTTTKAVIDRNLLTGLAGIDLKSDSSGGKEGPMLKDSGALADTPLGKKMFVLEEGKVQFREIADSATDILKSMDETLKEVRLVVSSENRERITSILRHTDTILAGFAKGSDGFAAIPKQVEVIAKELESLVKNTNGAISGIEEQIKRFTESIKFILASTGQSVKSATDRLGSAVEGFEEPDSLLLGPNPKKLGPGEGSRAR